jgi:CubicO group peptidase (beta-lactamase class C family)
MAEVVTGVPWDAIVGQQLRAPFGWSAAVAYFTAPRQAVGTLNPLIAGGLRASMSEHAKLLGLVHNRGTYEGQRLIAAALVEEMGRDPYPQAVAGFTPVAAAGLEYGLTAWLECATPATGCDVLSSAGAFGFMPWIDRGGGYYAIIGLEELGDASEFSVRLAVELRPLIRAAIRG